MSKHYCHENKPGIRCTAMGEDRVCHAGWLDRKCEYRKAVPFIPTTVRRSDTCMCCSHRHTCSYKTKYLKMISDFYPAILYCKFYDEDSVFKL